jgi:rare lipoprotein A
MLTLASGVFSEDEISQEGEIPFLDTPETEWYTKYIAAAKEKGIIKGYPDGSFQPDKNINLAETLKIYLEALQKVAVSPTSEDELFADTPMDEWYTPYTTFAGTNGLITINSLNQVFPNQEMTRGYMSEVIYRTIMHEQGYEFGKATFYGAAVQGHSTASGEIFDMYQFTAAHKTLPFGTIVEATNMANGKSVQVRITDRGPYGYGRVLDLTSGAFEEIAWLGTGVIDIQYKVISQ